MSRSSDPANGSQLLFDPPVGARRRRLNAGIALFLASQVAIPVTYYLYKEPTNERFAWRMFSSVHMSTWEPARIAARLSRNGRTLERALPVQRIVIESTWNSLYSGQPDVRDAYLQHLLSASDAEEVSYEAQGYWPSGDPMKPIRKTIRRSDAVTRSATE